MNMTPKQRRKELVRAIRNSWSSLESHLPFAITAIRRDAKKHGETENFHATAILEYADTIKVLSSELVSLTDPTTIEFFRKAARFERANNKQKE